MGTSCCSPCYDWSLSSVGRTTVRTFLTYTGEETEDEIATSLNSWTIFLMKHIQLCFLWCTERVEQNPNKERWKSPYSQLFITQCCSACAVRVTEQSSRWKSAVKNKMPAWSSDGFQCSLCSYFCPCKYCVFNSCITELILTDEHEAREAGRELTDTQLLVAGFLAKGFLEWF